MSAQEDAARDLREATGELIAFIAGCDETRWGRPSAIEGWPVAAVVYHCAIGNDLALAWICAILAGREVRETPDSHHAYNAADAGRYGSVSKRVAIDAVRRTSDRTADFIRSLTDEELERSALLGVATAERSVGQFIPNFGRHVRGHLAALRAPVADQDPNRPR